MASVSSVPIKGEDAVAVLVQAITKKIEAEAETTIREAVARYEQKLREAVGQAAMNAASHYSMRHMGSVLEIRVDLEDKRSR